MLQMYVNKQNHEPKKLAHGFLIGGMLAQGKQLEQARTGGKH